MRPGKTARIFGIILLVYGLALLPALFLDAYLDSPLGILVVLPYLSIYFFHSLGVPRLLEHGGACGWGWCAPTHFGWVFLIVVWTAIAWFLAWLIAALIGRSAKNPHDSSKGN